MAKYNIGDLVTIPSRNDGLVYEVVDTNPPERFGKNKILVENKTHEDGFLRVFIMGEDEVAPK